MKTMVPVSIRITVMLLAGSFPLAAEIPQRPPSIGNERFIAGQLCNRPLYWENRELHLDTIGWNAFIQRAIKAPSTAGNSPESSKNILRKAGKKILELRKVNAVSLAIIGNLGYPLAVLSQWSGAVRYPGVDTRGMLESGIILSDFIWEPIDSVAITRPWKSKDGHAIRIFFHGAGCSDFRIAEELLLARVQILGTQGFGFKEKNREYIPDENMSRLVLRICMLADSDKAISKIATEIETTMDILKLELGYRAPRIIELK